MGFWGGSTVYNELCTARMPAWLGSGGALGGDGRSGAQTGNKQFSPSPGYCYIDRSLIAVFHQSYEQITIMLDVFG